MIEPRIRVSALLVHDDGILLVRHQKQGRDVWLLPGGGVNGGESLVDALRRELAEEVGLAADIPIEGPIAIAESISPAGTPGKHVVHIVFAGELGHRSLASVGSVDGAVANHRLVARDELDELRVHPPIQRFLTRWRSGDPMVFLGALWAP